MSKKSIQALEAFNRVSCGDKKGYQRALKLAEKVDRLEQLALVDSILAARSRAYTRSV